MEKGPSLDDLTTTVIKLPNYNLSLQDNKDHAKKAVEAIMPLLKDLKSNSISRVDNPVIATLESYPNPKLQNPLGLQIDFKRSLYRRLLDEAAKEGIDLAVITSMNKDTNEATADRIDTSKDNKKSFFAVEFFKPKKEVTKPDFVISFPMIPEGSKIIHEVRLNSLEGFNVKYSKP